MVGGRVGRGEARKKIKDFLKLGTSSESAGSKGR